MTAARIAIRIADPHWRAVPRVRALAGACARVALATAPATAGEVTLLLADDATLHCLNRAFRGKDEPTNVLSFPAGDATALGDVAIAYGVAAGEARAAGRPLAHHLAHLVVHGVLHLLGHDHGHAREAARMERLEARLLADFGIPDPYRKAA